jgi:hypothetical protein
LSLAVVRPVRLRRFGPQSWVPERFLCFPN